MIRIKISCHHQCSFLNGTHSDWIRISSPAGGLPTNASEGDNLFKYCSDVIALIVSRLKRNVLVRLEVE